MKTSFKGLVPLLLLLTLPAVAQAQFDYVITNGTATITKYMGLARAVSIPGKINGYPVTTVGPGAFENANLTSITITNTITAIGDGAFYGCVGLAELIIPSSVRSIGASAFSGCSGLTGVTIPFSVTNLGDVAFYDCYNMISIVVEEDNPAYCSLDGVLFNMTKTTLLEYPGGKDAGYSIPEGVASIRPYAFSDTTLTDITIPGSVTNIETGAFWGCTNLASVVLSNGLASIPDYSFTGCHSLTNFAIPDSVTRIGFAAFSDCGLTGVVVPNSVASLGASAFASCTNLTSVVLSDSVSTIGDRTFYGCSSLTGVTLGKTLTNVGQYAFYLCSRLSGIRLPDSVTDLADYAFAYCASAKDVTLGKNLSNISQSAFINCGMNSIAIPDSVTNIGDYAFWYCTGLTDASIGKGVTTIGTYTFSGCVSLRVITVDPLNSRFSSLAGVLFDKNQTTLIQVPGAYSGAYDVPSSVTTIGIGALNRCWGLTCVTIPRSVTGLSTQAFYYCTNLTAVYSEGNAPALGTSVFEGDIKAIIYYLPRTTGWGSIFAGRPVALWKPQIQTVDGSFGVRTNQFGFTIHWGSGTTVVVETCTDPGNPVWLAVSTNTLTGGSSYFSDPQWTNYPRRFYRLRSP